MQGLTTMLFWLGQAGVFLVIAIAVLWAAKGNATNAKRYAKNPIRPEEVAKKRSVAQVLTISDLTIYNQLRLHIDNGPDIVGADPPSLGLFSSEHNSEWTGNDKPSRPFREHFANTANLRTH